MPDQTLSGGQGKTTDTVQPRPDLFYISPAAQRYMGYKMEAVPGAPPAAAQGGEGQGGQGQGGGGAQPNDGGGGFNWGLFPDVPEAQRPLLEPHLKQSQAHVTKIEQQLAPFKAVIDAGVEPEALQNLVAFDQQFSQNPVGMWLTLAENMQKEGTLSDELDLNAVKAILEGKDPQPVEGAGGDGQVAPDGGEMPAWAQQMQQENQELRARLDGRDQSEAAQQRAQQLDTALGSIKTQLTEAGYTDENLPDDDTITGMIIAHKGDVDKATAALSGLRENVLKGLTNGRTRSGDDADGDGPTMPNGAPKTPKRSSRGPGREFAEARAGAEQMLRSRQQAEAQGS